MHVCMHVVCMCSCSLHMLPKIFEASCRPCDAWSVALVLLSNLVIFQGLVAVSSSSVASAHVLHHYVVTLCQ